MMSPVRSSLVPSAAVAALLALPFAAGAQASPDRDRVPVSMLPPAGMCRIWMLGVPPAQQPASTDCATALRQRPANGMVLYGPARKDTESARFDPRVGNRARGTDSLDRAGSPAERELAERREQAERQRRYTEMREREEAARRAVAARAALNGSAGDGRAPSAGGGPRTATPKANGVTTTTGGGASVKAPASDPKPPKTVDPKKPE